MKIWIVFDSYFGNTEQIARQVGNALSSRHTVEVLRVGEVNPADVAQVDCVIVGSPTRGFRPSEATTGLLKSFERGSLLGKSVAAFDTRIPTGQIKSGLLRLIVNAGGYAAPAIAKKLQRSGGKLAAPPEGFFVTGTEGPLLEGELQRAAQWAESLLPA